MAQSFSFSIEELKTFLVKYHCLDNFDHFSRKGENGGALTPSSQIKKLMQRIGSIQYDPLNVVGRNPDLVLQSRIKNYHSGFLEDLLYKERALIDGWDKEMSIYLTAAWPSFGRVRRHNKDSVLRTLKHRGQEDVLSYLPQIMDEVKKRGPLQAREIKLGATQKNRWGHRQISGAAMDYLWTSGELGIFGKKSAQKIYAPIADLIPARILNAPEPFTNEHEFLEWYVLRRIGSMGAYWTRNGAGWQGRYLSDSDLRQKAIESLQEKKLIVPIHVPEINETFYIRKKDVPLLNEKDEYDGATRFLAPLDNMLWDRRLVKKIFDFEYTWEVYVPEAKRKYGYYVLPVLYRNSLIGRFEPAQYKKGQPFTIKNWWWEGGLKLNSKIKDAVKQGLENFGNYLGK